MNEHKKAEQQLIREELGTTSFQIVVDDIEEKKLTDIQTKNREAVARVTARVAEKKAQK